MIFGWTEPLGLVPFFYLTEIENRDAKNKLIFNGIAVSVVYIHILGLDVQSVFFVFRKWCQITFLTENIILYSLYYIILHFSTQRD